MNDILVNKDEIKKVVHEITLNVLNIISQKNNYKILTLLPADEQKISQYIDFKGNGLKNRLKQLENENIIELRGKNDYKRYFPTKLTKHVLDLIKLLNDSAEKEANTLIYKMNNKKEKL